MRVELIYDSDCPNIGKSREIILQAFQNLKLNSKWEEWDRSDPESPGYVKKFGSPTILVNGKDVSPQNDVDANCCRVYPDEEGKMKGTPHLKMMVAALQSAHIKNPIPWVKATGVLPALVTVFLPGLTCPACWPAYAGLLSAFGLGFFNYTPFLFPLMIVFLGLALFAFAYKAENRNGYKPLAVGVVASILVLIGRFYLASKLITNIGTVLLVIASLWNIFPKRKQPACPQCIN